MSYVQRQATRAEWDAFRNEDKYHPLRDGPREYETRWVIEKMAKYLPPEHVALARDLRALAAKAEGRRPGEYERVDGVGNGAEIALEHKLDAMTRLNGYVHAAASVLGEGGRLCMDCIAQELTLAQTLRRCGYAAGSDRSVRQLIQLTMMAAHDYHEMSEEDRERWNRNARQGMARCA